MDEDAMFDQLDTDGNGVIDEAELGAALKAMGAPIEVGQLFQMLDKNNDGSIDRTEFHAFYEMFSGGGEDDVDEMEELDEGPAAHTGAAEISEEDVVQEIMDDLDDGSGTVAADEVAGLSTNFFGIDRADFIQLLHSNNYTETSKLNRKDVENIVALCKSLAKLDQDIDLDGETDDEEQDDALGMEFDRVSMGSAGGNRLQDFEDEDEGDNAVDDARVVFNEIDIDKDGNVTFDEMFTALVEMGVDYTAAQKFAGQMVGSHSQTISFEDFKRVFASLLETSAEAENADGDENNTEVRIHSDNEGDDAEEIGIASTPVALQEALLPSVDSWAATSFSRHRRTLSNSSANSRGSAGSTGKPPDNDLKGEALEEESKQLDQRLDRLQEANRVARKREVELQEEISSRKTSLANLQSREDSLTEEISSLHTQEEQLRVKVSRLQSRVASSKQRESELAVIRTNINESVSKIQVSIEKHSSEVEAAASPSRARFGKDAELREHIAAMKAEQSDMDSQLEKLQKEFAENNEQIQELLQQSQADDEHMDNLRTQVHDIQSGKLHGHAMETSSRRASEQSSGIGDIGDFSNLALDLGNIALSSNEGPPTPTNEESLGSIISPDDEEEPSFGNLSLQLEISNGMINQSDNEDEDDDIHGISLEDSLAVCESVIEVPKSDLGPADEDGETKSGKTGAATRSSDTADGLEGGLSERDWEDAREAMYTKFVSSAISVLQKIKSGNLPRTPAPSRGNGSASSPDAKFGETKLTGVVQTFADKLFNQAVDLENDLLAHAKQGSFQKMYAEKPALPVVDENPLRKGRFSNAKTPLKRRATAGGGAIGLLLSKAVKLSALSGIVHETQMNRGDATVDAPIPEGSFRCAECYFINANLRLQCKQCMHLRFPTFDKRHLAVQKIVLKNTSGVLKTPGVLGKKYQFKVHGSTRITYVNLKTKKQKSIKFADISAISIDKRTLKLSLKSTSRNPSDDRSGGAAKSGGASGDVGLEVVYKAVSEKTASMLYNCIKQRLDRSSAVAALEQQERTRTANQELWVNHLNQCCDDVFDDVVGSSAGKSVLEAEAKFVKAGQAKDDGSIIASVREQFRTAATRKLIKKFDRIYPSLSAVLAGNVDPTAPSTPLYRF